MAMKLELDQSRLFSTDPALREVAQRLYEKVAELPILSPHGHVDLGILVRNEPFSNPAELFIYHDHYVTRLLHANGFSLEKLGRGEDKPRDAWRILCSNWHLFAGTASGYWLTHVFATVFGISEIPSSENADALYDLIASELLEPRMLPRELFKTFKIDFLATTDDPCDDLAAHQYLAADPSFEGRVAPTFRPDAYLDPRHPKFVENVRRLLSVASKTAINFANYIDALEMRRQFFIANGAVSSDHGVVEPFTTILDQNEAARLFDQAISGRISTDDARRFAGFMLTEMARMSCEDGLVMTIHAGVYRNHSSQTFAKFGADTGHDIPVTVDFVNNLRPLLETYGLNPKLKVILFALDETTWSREVAPLAGFYPSLFIGPPWWFLDSPDAMVRFREAVTDATGFYKGSGFIDDTRAFLSIPARHDMARRIDCAYLARLVGEGRLAFEQAAAIAVDLVTTIPAKAFNL